MVDAEPVVTIFVAFVVGSWLVGASVGCVATWCGERGCAEATFVGCDALAFAVFDEEYAVLAYGEVVDFCHGFSVPRL